MKTGNYHAASEGCLNFCIRLYVLSSQLFTKQNRGPRPFLCCSPDWKLLTRPECLEIWIVVCCRLILRDFAWEVCATTEQCFDNKVMCNWHQSLKKESQSPMQIRECEVVPNWVERLVHEVNCEWVSTVVSPSFRRILDRVPVCSKKSSPTWSKNVFLVPR